MRGGSRGFFFLFPFCSSEVSWVMDCLGRVGGFYYDIAASASLVLAHGSLPLCHIENSIYMSAIVL